ncbi:Oidioi.mRNA.OKI2018_I69.PAR.g12447.t1.cds [Oikopleura dioica]|uniref:Oidioi.mRNA.OKI2018_I69.PAR.g12447.t1.cds n=1 Tax=Oikopleura dioica TaxID=34765 RepID=A0ABN7S025_OIKDI|nr:Oidioi.mRNA.OKI2018_I69.PAR.g12447.t1.cds [Oikopleura dioica]
MKRRKFLILFLIGQILAQNDPYEEKVKAPIFVYNRYSSDPTERSHQQRVILYHRKNDLTNAINFNKVLESYRFNQGIVVKNPLKIELVSNKGNIYRRPNKDRNVSNNYGSSSSSSSLSNSYSSSQSSYGSQNNYGYYQQQPSNTNYNSYSSNNPPAAQNMYQPPNTTPRPAQVITTTRRTTTTKRTTTTQPIPIPLFTEELNYNRPKTYKNPFERSVEMTDFCTTNFPVGNFEQKRLCQEILANIPDRIVHLEGQLRSTIDMVNRVKTEQDETSYKIINELGAVDMDSRRLEERTEEQEKKLSRVSRTLDNGSNNENSEYWKAKYKYAYMVDVMEKKKRILEEMMDGVNTIHSTMKESLRAQKLIRSQKVLIPRKDMIVNEMAGYKKQPQPSSYRRNDQDNYQSSPSRSDISMPEQFERELYQIAKSKPVTKKTDATDCSAFDGPNAVDGKYDMSGIRDVRGRALTVRCEFIKGKGWIIIQRRVDGETNFTRGWNDYKNGFGTLSGGELWLGLEAIYRLTMNKPMLLEIIMEDTDGRTYTAVYKNFSITGESLNYAVRQAEYVRGNAGNSFYRNNVGFSTPDQDNDRHSKYSCGYWLKSGWWFSACGSSNLNGVYHNGKYTGVHDGVFWQSARGKYYSFAKTTMRIRPESGNDGNIIGKIKASHGLG